MKKVLAAAANELTESEFVEAVYDKLKFDENADQLTLQELSEKYELLRWTWCAGEPYEADAALSTLVTTFYAANPELRVQINQTLARLVEFCLNKSRANNRRLAGMIDIAQQYEAAAEREYNQLPQIWKW